MNITFQLRDSGYEKSSIRVVVTEKNKVYRKAIGLSCPTKSWRKLRNGTCRSGVDSIDEKMHRLETDLLEFLGDSPREYEILNALDTIEKGVLNKVHHVVKKRRKGSIPSFYEFYDEWCNSQSSGESTFRARKCARNAVMRLMGEEIDWPDINNAFYEKLVDLMIKNNFSFNYQASIVANLRSCMKKAYRLGYYPDLCFEDWKISTAETFKIALSPEEIQLIMDYKPKSTRELGEEFLAPFKTYDFCGQQRHGKCASAKTKEKVRDLFIVGYKTCARFSDYSRLTLDNIKNGKIVFIQEKTNKEVMIPCSPIVVEILKKYGGRTPDIGLNVFNKGIKQMCYELGINGEEEYLDARGSNRIYRVERWMIVGSHTARRTAATHLYMNGVPMKELMLLTGHKSMVSLERYLRLDNKKTIEKLAELEFFK